MELPGGGLGDQADAPDDDSVDHEGWESQARRRRRRRRRSITRMPALVEPADIPDDADGRVTFLQLDLPEDVIPEAVAGAEDTEEEADGSQANDSRSWLAMLILAVVLIAILLLVMRPR